MILSQLKIFLAANEALHFQLPDGTRVPAHFHVTEIGEVSKNFIDCGGTQREERVVSLQLWTSIDYHHRLAPSKLSGIIEMAEKKLGLGDLPIEVEYQGEDSIMKFGLEATDGKLQLTGTKTACLALEACGLPGKAVKGFTNLMDKAANVCKPGSGCC